MVYLCPQWSCDHGVPCAHSGHVIMVYPVPTVVTRSWYTLCPQWSCDHGVPCAHSGHVIMEYPVPTVVIRSWYTLCPQWSCDHGVPCAHSSHEVMVPTMVMWSWSHLLDSPKAGHKAGPPGHTQGGWRVSY